MIDIRVKEIGRGEVAATFTKADDAMRLALRSELALIGDEIVSRAQSNAPRRTGIMASKIIWFFGERRKGGKKDGGRTVIREATRGAKAGKILFSAMPTGRVAHLVERGVNASFHQRTGRGGKGERTRGRRAIGPYAGEAMHGPEFRYPRTLSIAPRPFFMPAVESVGGAAGVNARLQVALDRAAQGVSDGR
jgi:hypothetical protein